eukprot:scaffold49064_cov27-Phaeocystis_antarctica.AAC.1
MPQVPQAAGSITPVVAVLQQRRARRDVLANPNPNPNPNPDPDPNPNPKPNPDPDPNPNQARCARGAA